MKKYHFVFNQKSIHKNSYVILDKPNMYLAWSEMRSRFGKNGWRLIEEKELATLKTKKDLSQIR